VLGVAGGVEVTGRIVRLFGPRVLREPWLRQWEVWYEHGGWYADSGTRRTWHTTLSDALDNARKRAEGVRR